MNIWRGFRRLSVLAAVCGEIAVVILWLQAGRQTTLTDIILGSLVFAGIPAGLVLLLGWVIAGFRTDGPS
jgi:hypothetical protein